MLAEHYWPGQDPTGKRLHRGPAESRCFDTALISAFAVAAVLLALLGMYSSGAARLGVAGCAAGAIAAMPAA